MYEMKIRNSVKKFNLNLKDKIVFTEAASGNYVVTPIIAALADAKVYAYTKDSKYGSVEEVKKQTYDLAQKIGIKENISIIEDLDEVNLKEVDILTNTGFLRPVNRKLINRLSSKCVIPLMWEPWEYRRKDLDLEACVEHGIKVYGTNESDDRLRTLEYIGFTVLYILLKNKLSPFSSNVLFVGCERFVNPVAEILKQNDYEIHKITDYSSPATVKGFDSIVVLEHERDGLIIGDDNAFIKTDEIDDTVLVMHICGNVSFKNAKFKYIPDKPSPFGYMSFTADYIDSQAVIALHTAGLKVAEGMLKSNGLGLKGLDYKGFMEKTYPALAFEDSRFW